MGERVEIRWRLYHVFGKTKRRGYSELGRGQKAFSLFMVPNKQGSDAVPSLSGKRTTTAETSFHVTSFKTLGEQKSLGCKTSVPFY